VVVLAAITAVIHLSLAFPDPVFILNGLGYLTLTAALLLPLPILARYRTLIRWAFVGYTALTILIWVAIGERTPIAYVAKLAEVLLIVLLVLGRGADEGEHSEPSQSS
jgi:hypothetical protein